MCNVKTIKPRTAPRPRKNASPIARARLASGLTQKQLADLVGCNQKDISRWETGDRKPTIDSLMKLSKALNLPLEEIAYERRRVNEGA